MDHNIYIYLTDPEYNGTLGERSQLILPSGSSVTRKHHDKHIEFWQLDKFLTERYTPVTNFILVFGVTELPEFQDYNKIFEVVQLIKDKKNIHLLFVNDCDLYDHSTWDREDHFVRSLQTFDNSRLRFLFNNTLTVEKFKNKFPLSTVEFGSSFIDRFYENVPPLKEYTGPRYKHFLCLNSRPAEHRDEIFNKLSPMKNSYLSYRLRNIFLDEDNPWNTNQQLFFKTNPKILRGDIGIYAPDQENNWARYQDIIDEKYYTDSCIYICTDTLFSGLIDGKERYTCTHWWTEKLIKSFHYKLPVIYVGLPYALESIKTLGFKTFNDFWSESYDNQLNPVRRMNMIKSVIDEISAYSVDQLNNLYYNKKMQGILNHNNNLLQSLYDKYKRS